MWIGAQALIDTKETGGRNPLVDEAARLTILPRDSDGLTPEEMELDRIRGPKVADNWEDDPRLQASKPVAADPKKGQEASNPTGSYEAFMASFGARMVQPQD